MYILSTFICNKQHHNKKDASCKDSLLERAQMNTDNVKH